VVLASFFGSLAAWMWTVIAALFIGIFIGGLARLFLPGKQKISLTATWMIGFVAALLGGMVAQMFGVGDTGGVDWIKLAMQIGIAVVFVGIYSGWFFTEHK
jgi:uncharacterized membrane protein YeaQ/YmgE (transglycosylase-associated protein family)